MSGCNTTQKKSRIPRYVGPWTTQTKKRPIELDDKTSGKDPEKLPKCRRRILDKDVKGARAVNDPDDVPVHFEPDSKALASILNNEGITVNFYKGPVATRPGGPSTDIGQGRPSTVYYQGPASRMSIIESNQNFKAFIKQRMSEYSTAKPKQGLRTPGNMKTPGKKPDHHPSMSKTPSAVYFSPSKQYGRNCITPKPFHISSKSPHGDRASPHTWRGGEGKSKWGSTFFHSTHKSILPNQKQNSDTGKQWRSNFNQSSSSQEVKTQDDLASHLDLLSISNKSTTLFKVEEQDETSSVSSGTDKTISKSNQFGTTFSPLSSAHPLAESQKGNIFNTNSTSAPFTFTETDHKEMLEKSFKEENMTYSKTSISDNIKSRSTFLREFSKSLQEAQVAEQKENLQEFQGFHTPTQSPCFSSLFHTHKNNVPEDSYHTPPMQNAANLSNVDGRSHTLCSEDTDMKVDSDNQQSSSTYRTPVYSHVPDLLKFQAPFKTPVQSSQSKKFGNPSPGPVRVQVQNHQPSPAPVRIHPSATSLGLQPPARTPVLNSCLKKKPERFHHVSKDLTESSRKTLRWADTQDSDEDLY